MMSEHETAPEKPEEEKVPAWKDRLLWLYSFSNMSIIVNRLVPRKDPVTGKYSHGTFWLWIIGIYAAMYGIASARYESALDRQEIRANILATAIFNKDSRAEACSQVGFLQREKILTSPEFTNPLVTWRSFRGAKAIDEGTVNLLKDTVVSVKKELQGANLFWVNLSRTDLKGASIADANLRKANLSGANLVGADLVGADLSFADLSGAILNNAKLGGADLFGTTLGKANLSLANLSDIQNWHKILFIQNANIYGVKNAPEGFRKWALANGACEIADRWEWAKNGCPQMVKKIGSHCEKYARRSKSNEP